MDCLVPFADVLDPVTVVEWISKDHKVTHVFNKAGDDVMLYPDDSLLRVIQKISVTLGKQALPYVWNKRKSMLFSVKFTHWTGYTVNPFESSNTDNQEGVDPMLVSHEKLLLGNLKRFNIVYQENVHVVNERHYFPDFKIHVMKRDVLLKEEAVLKRLLQYSVEDHNKLQRSNQICKYKHIVFTGSAYKQQTSPYFLEDMYYRLHANASIPFIQWMDDPSKILYKVYKRHTIPQHVFDGWVSYTNIPKVKSSLILYSPIGKTHVYARVYLSTIGDITITYHIDARDKVDLSTITEHKNDVMTFVATFTGIKYDVQIHDISVRSELVIPSKEITLASLASFMGSLLPIFHVIKLHNSKIYAIYKRAKNYNDSIQLTEYIQSKLNMGITSMEIQSNLIDMGIPENEVQSYIEQATLNPEENINVKKIETGTLIYISKVNFGIKVYITNASSVEEVRRVFHWIRSCILHMPSVVVPRQNPRKEHVPSASSVAKTSLSRSSSNTVLSSSSSTNALAESVASEDLDFLGGAVGKEHQRYFLNMLQEADPGLFSNPEYNYARMCQASAFHQPVVLTMEEKDKMIEEGYGDAVDNIIIHGSDPNTQNAYFCPRIWCPAMKRPITYETYMQNGNKCPNGEDAKLMYDHTYWRNSHDVKHYIGFHKNKTSSGLCLPCCYIKPTSESKQAECKNPVQVKKPETSKTKSKPSDRSSSSSPKSTEKDETYLMTQVAPLPKGRSGSIPQVLHEIISPNITYQLCNKTLTSQQCPVRHGIHHHKDSLMHALAYAMSMPSKKHLVNFMRTVIDPLTFLALENGNVVAAFVNDQGVNPAECSDTVKKLTRYLANNEKYVKLMGLEDVESDAYKLSRELQLYMARMDYFKYLESDEVKSVHHLYDLFHHIGYLLVVWDKESMNDIQLRCPTYACVHQLLNSVEEHRNTIMLLYENGVYEPIEMKRRNTEAVRVIDTKNTTSIDDALRSCGSSDNDKMYTIVATLQTINEWVKRALFHNKPYVIDTCVLSPDLCIAYFMTSAGIIIRPPSKLPIRLLIDIVRAVEIQHIVHEEDVMHMIVQLSLLRSDFDLFARKIQSIGFGYDIGVPNPGATRDGYHQTTLTGTIPTTPPAITLKTQTEITRFSKHETKLQQEWHNLQELVSRTFIENYETLVAPTLNMSRDQRIHVLANTFHRIPDRKMVTNVIEEIPLEYGKPTLVAWWRMIGRYERFPFFKDEVRSSKKEWIFSQRAVENGNMQNVIVPIAANGARPSLRFTPSNVKTELYRKPEPLQHVHAVPSMLSMDATTTRTKLPSKWTQMRSYEWAKYSMIKHTNYEQSMIPQLLQWIAAQRHAPVVWGDIQYIRHRYVLGALQDEPTMLMLLEDPSLNTAFGEVFGKSYKSPQKLWDRIRKKPFTELKQIWNDITSSNTLWASDLDLYVAAKLLNITVLILHRSKYGVSKEDKKRGDFDDLSVSTSLYTKQYTKTYIEKIPLCILYKDVDNDHAVYSPVIDENNTFLFHSLYYCPKDIRRLVDFLIENKMYPSFK